jgi:hypothetical protein
MNDQKWEKLDPYRAVVAVDARDFGSLDSGGMQRVNHDIQQLLAEAMSKIGLSGSWLKRHFGQHTGDGYVAGVEPEDLPPLVGCFPGALRSELHQHRRPDGRPLQLRVSVHVGPLPDSGIGDPMVATHRLLDDGYLRRILAKATPELTPLAMIVSDRVYEDVFSSGRSTGGVGPQEFARSLVQVKTFEKPAWVHIPGLDWGLADPSLLLTKAPSENEPKHQETAPQQAPGQPSSGITFNNHGSNVNQGYLQNIRNGEQR